jgi:hypothetical protein
MLGAISQPTQICPYSSKISPLKPLPHPMSNKKADSSSGNANSSIARWVICAWMDWTRELVARLANATHRAASAFNVVQRIGYLLAGVLDGLRVAVELPLSMPPGLISWPRRRQGDVPLLAEQFPRAATCR